ncbi:hypothetical protein P053_01744 [Brucella abortus 01-4165]|uniref:Sugar ABC transporter, periplasmic sugar-binding protein, putative n=4 Tax=Brucella abortus TaxID=235 RepID=A0A0F6AVZ7_BRUA1|nr:MULTISPECIES: extracellular solute-binding protein [Brucella]ERM87264.1 glycerol-3-phosphate ABC transporter substrate-binding protein [Brucella abortus 82]ERT79092.1 hypothetical protein P050_03395 [Brucella abortus 90-12178]ERT96984.1 hypothetical protein P038_03100 [Brucella abortus 99-9971-135]KFH19003.1 glycerol-3-phosphate ABC transporter substrate-binding protein [Brucella abortus LMN1]KFH25865.1 glycerol-3-phosphate ABC transporter substrate-binding protein [Brucella abortus LMN2]
MKRFSSALAALAIVTGLASPAFADTTLNVHYPMPGFFKDVMADISKKFMEENPDIKINFVSPSATYEEGIQTIMRQAGTSEMPDITFTGLNRLRVLAERNIGVDMKPLIEKETDMEAQGFTDHLLSLARVGDRQVGLAFATSNPIMYYNADLLKAAGGDPDNPPTTWDEVIELGGKIKALGNGNEGIDFRWQGDDWMFSALLFGAGGTILTEDPAKQDAAWKFAKFAAGPYGASVVVPGTGYVPNNELAAKSDEYLGKFYEENPLFKAGLSQMSLMIPWYAFPGSNGVKVTQTIVDNLSRVVEQSATPEDALADAAKEVQRLLPRR